MEDVNIFENVLMPEIEIKEESENFVEELNEEWEEEWRNSDVNNESFVDLTNVKVKEEIHAWNSFEEAQEESSNHDENIGEYECVTCWMQFATSIDLIDHLRFESLTEEDHKSFFSNHETEALLFLQSKGIIPYAIYCRNGHIMAIKGNIWRCNRKECRQNIGLRKGTWLENSHLSLTTIILFIYAWSAEKSSFKFCNEILSMSHISISSWSKFLRKVCSWKVGRNRQIGGEGLHVEIDENLLFQCKKSVNNLWVFGGICRETNQCFIVPVQNRKVETYIQIIKQRIAPKSIIISDCSRVYNDIANHDFQHLTVNHSRNRIDPETLAHTQNIKRIWRSLKFDSKKRGGTPRKELTSYLEELMWRTEVKGNPFDAILKDIKQFHVNNCK